MHCVLVVGTYEHARRTFYESIKLLWMYNNKDISLLVTRTWGEDGVLRNLKKMRWEGEGRGGKGEGEGEEVNTLHGNSICKNTGTDRSKGTLELFNNDRERAYTSPLFVVPMSKLGVRQCKPSND